MKPRDLVPSLSDRLRAVQPGGGPAGSLRERVARRLHARQARGQCLLLDVSGSMAEDCGDGRPKIEALKAIARDFPRTRQFSFSSVCVEAPPSHAGGNTDMAGAFATLKRAGITHCVLITDGIPDSEDAALREATGLTIDVIYVGPPPEPPFLARLARATGGQYGAGSLARPQEIEQRVQRLLLEDRTKR
jgi:hypothetical protein